MKKRYFGLIFLLIASLASGQQSDIVGTVVEGAQAPRIAVPDIRGVIGVENEDAFNTTLWNDLEAAGQFEMISKSFYPRTSPRKPEELQSDASKMPEDPSARGLWLEAWGAAPVITRYLAFGELEVSGDRLVLSGYLYDVTIPELQSAHVLGQRYYASLDEAGARKVAHDFSRDILSSLGLGVGLAGTRVYFVSDRSGNSEIWSMDYDGANLKQETSYRNLTLTPAISPDGTRLSFTTFVGGKPSIYIHSLETGRRLTFYNQDASLNTTPSFDPNGERIYFASSATGHSQIYQADLDGRNLRRISYSRSIDVHPAINPKTGAQIAFVSGRSGLPQIYLMDSDGANVRKMSGGGGDAVQPAWDPQGENIAFAWTRGFEPGNYNIFIVNVATGNLVQLTHGAGRNEHPYWSPSGTHIVFSSDRSGGEQLWTMRADGTQLRKLTVKGRNRSPVWGVR